MHVKSCEKLAFLEDSKESRNVAGEKYKKKNIRSQSRACRAGQCWTKRKTNLVEKGNRQGVKGQARAERTRQAT